MIALRRSMLRVWVGVIVSVQRACKCCRAVVPEQNGVRKKVVFDGAGGHYHLLQTGWKNHHRIHGSLVHIDVREGKVWMEHDGINLEIVQNLRDAGIPQEPIVRGFHAPELRRFTEFAHA